VLTHQVFSDHAVPVGVAVLVLPGGTEVGHLVHLVHQQVADRPARAVGLPEARPELGRAGGDAVEVAEQVAHVIAGELVVASEGDEPPLADAGGGGVEKLPRLDRR
jgi:hypothetical protein